MSEKKPQDKPKTPPRPPAPPPDRTIIRENEKPKKAPKP